MTLIQNPPREIADSFWMLGTDPYPLYLYRGRQNGTLFEGGTGAMGPVLARQLQTLGIAADYVRQAVVTHAHPDHVMAIPLFRELFPQVTILASAPAARTLGSEKAMSFFGKLDDMLTTSLVKAGLVAEEPRQAAGQGKPFAVDRVLREGDLLEVDDNVAFRVLETPGHSDCSLSFHQPEKGLLVISDATGYYLPEQDCWWPNYFFSYPAYVGSIERLAALQADVLCLSHNAVIQGRGDVADYFSRALDATRRYHQNIIEQARAGQSVRQIAEVLGAEAYQRTPLLPLDFFQKNCSLLVKQSLAHEGMASD